MPSGYCRQAALNDQVPRLEKYLMLACMKDLVEQC